MHESEHISIIFVCCLWFSQIAFLM